MDGVSRSSPFPKWETCFGIELSASNEVGGTDIRRRERTVTEKTKIEVRERRR
jgi:hypothetical protein